jgi:hypothetical protein
MTSIQAKTAVFYGEVDDWSGALDIEDPLQWTDHRVIRNEGGRHRTCRLDRSGEAALTREEPTDRRRATFAPLRFRSDRSTPYLGG